MSWTYLLLLSLLPAQPGQAEISLDTELGAPSPAEIVVYTTDLEDAWLELTHLGSDASPVLVHLEAGEPAEDGFRFVPDLPLGPTMICSGAKAHGVSCEQVYRGDDELDAEIEVGFAEGLEIRGLLRQDLEPVVEARISLVPAGLEAYRPYTMPLEVERVHAMREVESGDDGFFALPSTAPGAYFLEVVLPSGRVHHTDPFDLPDRDALRRNFEVDDRLADELDLYWDLGVIDVPSGLDVRFVVSDLEGEPIAGAVVSAIQGTTPNDMARFVGATDREGLALLHGLDVERPVRVTCEKKGYEPIELEYELLPVEVDCVLRRWAKVYGEVIGPGSQAPRAATVTLRRAADEGQANREDSLPVAADGAFIFGEVTAGEYELRVAAPVFGSRSPPSPSSLAKTSTSGPSCSSLPARSKVSWSTRRPASRWPGSTFWRPLRQGRSRPSPTSTVSSVSASTPTSPSSSNSARSTTPRARSPRAASSSTRATHGSSSSSPPAGSWSMYARRRASVARAVASCCGRALRSF